MAALLVGRLVQEGLEAVLVPMDGFHLAQLELERLGRAARKGAPDTFDGAGFVALLARLRLGGEATIYAPTFRRDLEEPIAGAIAVPPGARLVVTEGNYLLDQAPPWDGVRPLVDEIWYVELDENVRIARLIARHVAHGRSEPEARRWVKTVDQANAVRVEGTRARADLVVTTRSSRQRGATSTLPTTPRSTAS